jgi:hypothetical protein
MQIMGTFTHCKAESLKASRNFSRLVFDMIIDSGAASHAVPGAQYLDPGSAYESFTDIEVVGGNRIRSTQRGSVTLISTKGVKVVLQDVLVVPGGTSFLLSKGKLDNKG